jgi:hypothetical protein
MRMQTVTAEAGIVICFPDEPDFDPISETMYEVRSDYVYKALDGVEITVPRGFQSDGLSAPRATWTLIGMPPDGYYRAAACIHDFLYSNGGVTKNKTYTREEADKLLLEIMTRLGIEKLKCAEAYDAVRLFGEKHWVPAT